MEEKAVIYFSAKNYVCARIARNLGGEEEEGARILKNRNEAAPFNCKYESGRV